jgi:hypothetical protein
MRNALCVCVAGLLLLMLGLPAALAQGGETPTPTATAQFVLPIINATLLLPTSFSVSQPTLIPLPPLATLDTAGAAVSALNFFQDSYNHVRVLIAAMGIFINFFFFAALLNAAFGLFGLWRARLMGVSYREWADDRRYRSWVPDASLRKKEARALEARARSRKTRGRNG